MTNSRSSTFEKSHFGVGIQRISFALSTDKIRSNSPSPRFVALLAFSPSTQSCLKSTIRPPTLGISVTHNLRLIDSGIPWTGSVLSFQLLSSKPEDITAFDSPSDLIIVGDPGVPESSLRITTGSYNLYTPADSMISTGSFGAILCSLRKFLALRKAVETVATGWSLVPEFESFPLVET